MNSNQTKNVIQLCSQRLKIWSISAIFIFISLCGLIVSSLSPNINAPLNPGLDFTGGTQITLERICDNQCSNLNTSLISQSIGEINLSNKDNNRINLTSSRIQILDNSQSILIRLPFLSADIVETVINNIDNNFGPINRSNLSVDTIGPKLGFQLLKSSLLSLLVAFAGISIYISFRYDQRYAILALSALAHDVLIVCGCFSWLGILFNVEVDSLFAVSLLTIAGYSVNNTVVVFDRIRECNRFDNDLIFSEQIDLAVTSTLTRTLYTSATTLMPLIALMLFGGTSLYWFALSLSLGVIVGGWSSIALAPSLLSRLKKSSN